MSAQEPKKPPACNPCRARRVLCHPQPNGAPCPRCAEKKIICTTTPVPRGRPRKNPLPDTTTMSAQGPKKPPACDICKARRIACSSQPDGAPCSRCVEKKIICTTTPAPRGRPRKNPHPHLVPQQLSPQTPPQGYEILPECPDLTPELVAHLFECFDKSAQFKFMNPVIGSTSIATAIRTVSFQLNLLPTQLRVLALCIIAHSTFVSFHEAVLGPGPRPASFTDEQFFSSRADVQTCGVRRAAACHALHAEALKAAWDAGVILQVSNENAASCLLLDHLEQSDFNGASRPWASAYVAHIRALAPIWRTSAATPPYGSHWAAFLMVEALQSTQSRQPMLITRHDQQLLCGPEPVAAEALLASLEVSSGTPGPGILFQSMKPYMFYITCLARELYETIVGDHARLSPLSEAAVMKFLSSLSVIHAILSRLLDRADAFLSTHATKTETPFLLNADSEADIASRCAYGVIAGFVTLVLALHREFEYRDLIADSAASSAFERARLELLRTQTRDTTALGLHALARGIRYFPPIHYAPQQWHTMRGYAQFALREAAVDPERVRDIATLANHLRRMCYSINLPVASLLEQLDGDINNNPLFFDSSLFLPPLDGTWMDPNLLMIGT